MLLGLFLRHRSTRDVDSLGVPLLCLPNEILKKVAVVLGQQEILGLLHNLSEIGNKGLSFGRELLGWVGECLRLEEAVQRNIDLVVLDKKKESVLYSISVCGRTKLGILHTEGTLPCWKALAIP